MKRALITGITGQDGSYLAEFLLHKGYEVHGIVRRTSSMARSRIDHLNLYQRDNSSKLFLHYGDLAAGSSLAKPLYEIEPDEIYNLAAQSHVRVSFDIPEYTNDINSTGVARLLNAIVETKLAGSVRFYQASSSEMFGKALEIPQSESTAFNPCSPYACSKCGAHWLTVNYRQAYGLFACCGILFNHESPRRGENFVTRKISLAAANIKLGRQKKLYLGNLDAQRDWGYSPEYVEGMWLMLQQDHPDDYVLATGVTYSVRQFLDAAFEHVGLNWREFVEFDPLYLRPTEVDLLLGNSLKAKSALGWEPRTGMADLARLMVDSDLEILTEKP
ncbi:MAG: GDP-mannose 4,6-dehydratase [Planctomycetes bacterium RBG_13_63_9]|nr:MAG: GDP-mannose 4,6-dehydratase [Planctomycetes bacterium RBG_13_63_9]